MKKRIVALALLAALLPLTGCAQLLHRQYSVVEPHASTYYEREDVLRAESYQDIVNDLLLLIGQQVKEGTVWFFPDATAPDVTSLAEEACREVQTETPLGAYAVDYLIYTVDDTPRNYTAIEFTIGYRRTPEEMGAMVHATSISALEALLYSAVEREVESLAVRLSYFENQHTEVQEIVSRVQSGSSAAQDAPWQVHFYPASGDVGIIEILLKNEKN